MGVSDIHFVSCLRSIWATCLLLSLSTQPPGSLPRRTGPLPLPVTAAWPASPLLGVSGSSCHFRSWMTQSTTGPGMRPHEHWKKLDSTFWKCLEVNYPRGEI